MMRAEKTHEPKRERLKNLYAQGTNNSLRITPPVAEYIERIEKRNRFKASGTETTCYPRLYPKFFENTADVTM